MKQKRYLIMVSKLIVFSVAECGMIIDRDINGCKNILKMLMVSLNQMDKPEAFKRTNKSLPSLAQKVNLSVKVKTL